MSIFVYADLPEPQVPYDGTDKVVPIDELEAWTRAHADAQVARIAATKTRVLALLADHSAQIIYNARGLPTIQARVSAELLRSAELNAPDIVRIDPIASDQQPAALLGYAGRSAMAARFVGDPLAVSQGGLSGGACGGACDGGQLKVGLWESTELGGPGDPFTGIAINNARIASHGITAGFLNCPDVCSTDADCPDDVENNLITNKKSCRAPFEGGQKVCVQAHLSWVAASLGMFGSYAYDTNEPPGGEPHNNPLQVPPGTTFASTGVWDADLRIGNSSGLEGLDFLITTGPANPGTMSDSERRSNGVHQP